MCFRKVGWHPFFGKSEVVGLAGNPDQAYGAELAEHRIYPHQHSLCVGDEAAAELAADEAAAEKCKS